VRAGLLFGAPQNLPLGDSAAGEVDESRHGIDSGVVLRFG
jgi:hypothetical protein